MLHNNNSYKNPILEQDHSKVGVFLLIRIFYNLLTIKLKLITKMQFNQWLIKLKNQFQKLKIWFLNLFWSKHHRQVQKYLRKTTVFNVLEIHQWVLISFHLLLWLVSLTFGILLNLGSFDQRQDLSQADQSSNLSNLKLAIWFSFGWATLVLSYFSYCWINGYRKWRDRDLLDDHFPVNSYHSNRKLKHVKRKIRQKQNSPIVSTIFNPVEQSDNYKQEVDVPK